MKTLLTALCFLMLTGVLARGETTVKQYKIDIASKSTDVVFTTKVYIFGLAEGIQYMTVGAAKPRYCQPKNLALGMDNYVDIVDRRIEALANTRTEAQLESMWIVTVLVEGLQETFPCPKGK